MRELELWQAVVLGVVEGVTEYLPISSTGHLILASAAMELDLESQAVKDFGIVIQGGAILAVLGLYWPAVVKMLQGLIGRDTQGLRLLANLVIAFLPSAVVGLLLNKWIDSHLMGVLPVMAAVLVGGVYMIGVDLWGQGRLGRAGAMRPWRAEPKSIYDVTAREALMIGLLQCFALWPGTSRSMMTISGGLFAGLRGREAAQFSFLLGLPTLTAATLYKLYKNLSHAKETGTPNMFEVLGVGACVLGIAVAAVSAGVAVKWLVGFLTRHGLAPFGWYRIGLFVVLVVLSLTGVLSIGGGAGQDDTRPPQTVAPLSWPEEKR
ncbi:MAG TPA: undecaprenyl-diphosphate phosphatase [Phycisphaerales bacterium]|nr:undecaprenyl-diphosphate phosphatase [Phycisphaerales bacterium]